ncbi:hypothetical protein [Bradyrhizobium canariense]|uniref:hypothetical protein n=1 Tax=Bradyrhizobium canariense TaxID=255045 RepID=UPI001177BA95|nr:hypothetical protein [Bradyrhizobium canariense]
MVWITSDVAHKAFNDNAMAGCEPGSSGRDIVYSKNMREAGLNRELNDQVARVRRASVISFIAATNGASGERLEKLII